MLRSLDPERPEAGPLLREYSSGWVAFLATRKRLRPLRQQMKCEHRPACRRLNRSTCTAMVEDLTCRVAQSLSYRRPTHTAIHPGWRIDRPPSFDSRYFAE